MANIIFASAGGVHCSLSKDMYDRGNGELYSKKTKGPSTGCVWLWDGFPFGYKEYQRRLEGFRSCGHSIGYGFVVDYLAEILRSLRNHDYSDRYKEHFSLSSDISTRDRDGINKTFSGLMKILFPHDGATKEEIEELLWFAIEGRKRVKG